MGRFYSWLETRWSLVSLAFQLGGAIVSFGIPAWAAQAAHLFPQYSPFSWVAAGFAGLAVCALAYALYGYARGRIAVAKFQLRVQSVTAVNPLDSTFERRRIAIGSLSPPIGGLISDKTFVDCDLVGPANVIMLNCTFDRNSGNGVDAIIIKDWSRPTNGFGFTGCSFTRCRFYLVTFMVPGEYLADFTKYNWTGLNWITEVPQPLLPGLTPVSNTSLTSPVKS